jgi:hypothetical protein
MRYSVVVVVVEGPLNRTYGRYCNFIASHPLDPTDDLLRRSHEVAERVGDASGGAVVNMEGYRG